MDNNLPIKNVSTTKSANPSESTVQEDLAPVINKHKSKITLWILRIAWATVAIVIPTLIGAVIYLRNTIIDIKTDQKLFRSETELQIQKEFANQKETYWKEQKQRIDGLQQFADSYELFAKLSDTNNSRRYRESIRLFQEYTARTSINDVPPALKKPIFSEAMRSFSLQGDYGLITDTEIAEMENCLRNDMSTTMAKYYLACILLGKGHIERSRAHCKSGMSVFHESSMLATSLYSCGPPEYQSELAEYYALLIIIELASSKRISIDDRINDCWALLTDCEQRAIVHPSEISARFDRSSLQALIRHLKISQPRLFATSINEMQIQLNKYYFACEIDPRASDGSNLKGASKKEVKRIPINFPMPLEIGPNPKDK